MNEAITIKEVKGVFSYLRARGWRASLNTLYRHIAFGHLRRNQGGVFDSNAIDLYAKRFLKRLNVLIPFDQTPEMEAAGDVVDDKKTLKDLSEVSAYLESRGWFITKTTLYRHVGERKLKRNQAGRFDLIAIDKYARKYLKCLDVENPSSVLMARRFLSALESFIHDSAERTACFLTGDGGQAGALKEFLTSEAINYFKLPAQDDPPRASRDNGDDPVDIVRVLPAP